MAGPCVCTPALALAEAAFGLPNSAETLELPLESILIFVMMVWCSDDTSIGRSCFGRGGRLAFVAFFFISGAGRGGLSHIMSFVRAEGDGGLAEMSDGVVGGMKGCTGS